MTGSHIRHGRIAFTSLRRRSVTILTTILAATVLGMSACAADDQKALSITSPSSALRELTIATTALPNGTPEVPYNETLGASGGSGGYSWSILSGTLPTGLTLSQDGLVSGTPSAAGLFSFSVEVTSDGESDTRALSIVVSGSFDVGGSREPAGLRLLTHRRFDSYAANRSDDAGAEGWSPSEGMVQSGVGAVSIVSDPTAPISPDNVARFKYSSGMTGGGAPATAETRAWPTVREFYHRFAFKTSANFQGHLTSTNKLFHIFEEPIGDNRMFYSIDGAGSGTLRFTPRLQTPADTREVLRSNAGPSDGDVIKRDQWYTVEVYIKLNTYSGSTAHADGVYRVWIDGVLTHDYTDIMFNRNNEQSTAIQLFQFSPTWGGLDDTVKNDMYIYLDDVYASGR